MEEKKDKYSVEERVHNLEELIWSLFIGLGIVGIITFYEIKILWINIILISILAILFGDFSVRFFTLAIIIGDYWEKFATNFIEQKKKEILFIVKWTSIICAIFISKILMKYNWQETLGILILAVIGNILTTKIIKKNISP